MAHAVLFSKSTNDSLKISTSLKPTDYYTCYLAANQLPDGHFNFIIRCRINHRPDRCLCYPGHIQAAIVFAQGTTAAGSANPCPNAAGKTTATN